MKKYCTAPFEDLVITINRKGETVFSCCCYNYSPTAWFPADSIKEAIGSRKLQDFRKNACNNCMHLCQENCWKWKQVAQYPPEALNLSWVQLNISEQCNARCTFCYQTNYKFKVRSEVIEEFKRDYLPHIKRVYLGGGEPLLAARDLIDYIIEKYPGVQIGMVTNGILLDGYLDRLDKFYEINISLNASNKALYKKVMGVDCYDKVISNIKKLLARGYKGHLSATFILCRENLNDAENFLALCAGLSIKHCGIVLDNTDPFLRITKGTKAALYKKAQDLGLVCDLTQLDRKLGLLKSIKQIALYLFYYGPRRLRYLYERRI